MRAARHGALGGGVEAAEGARRRPRPQPPIRCGSGSLERGARLGELRLEFLVGLAPERAARVRQTRAHGRRLAQPCPLAPSSLAPSGASTTPGSRCPTAPGSPRGSGCPRTPSRTLSRRSSSTSRTARATPSRSATRTTTRYFAGLRLRGRARRPARERRLGRHPARRVPAAGAGRRARGDRLARRAALVQRHGRACSASPGAASTACRWRPGAARAEGRDLDVRERRPLLRRRSLRRRLRARRRHAAVGGHHAHPERAAARPRRGGRRLAGDLARAHGGDAAPTSRPGSPTSAATTTGATARCARTTSRSRRPCTRSAAGRTATRTRYRASSPGCPGPRKGLIGPWSHAFPQDGEPGPAIGFLQECLRWWDHWLKGIDTGIMDEPVLRAWMQDARAAGRPLRRAAGSLGDRGRVAVALDRQLRELDLRGCASRSSTERRVDRRRRRRLVRRRRPGRLAAPISARRTPRSAAFTFPSRSTSSLDILGFPEVELTLESDRPEALRRRSPLRRRARTAPRF